MVEKKLKKQEVHQKNQRLAVLPFKTLLIRVGLVDVSNTQAVFGQPLVIAKIVPAISKQKLLEVGILLQ